MNRESLLSAETGNVPSSPIQEQQQLTRGSVYKATADAVNWGVNAASFTTDLALYATGAAARATVTGLQAAYRGAAAKPFRP